MATLERKTKLVVFVERLGFKRLFFYVQIRSSQHVFEPVVAGNPKYILGFKRVNFDIAFLLDDQFYGFVFLDVQRFVRHDHKRGVGGKIRADQQKN